MVEGELDTEHGGQHWRDVARAGLHGDQVMLAGVYVILPLARYRTYKEEQWQR